MGKVRFAGLAVAAMLGLAACAGPSVGAPAVAPAPSADTLELVVGGIGRPIAGGDEVPLAGGLMAAVRLAPGEGRHQRSLDLFVHRHRAGATTPVNDATVLVAGQMRHMDHGAFRAAAQPTGDGGYRVALPFAMPGEWRLDVEVAAPDGRASVELDVDVAD